MQLGANVEYLVVFPDTGSFCDTAQGFLRLIQVDSKVKVESGRVRYEGEIVGGCELAHGQVEGRSQRYFHLSMSWVGELTAPNVSLDGFTSALRSIRETVGKAGGEVEILWDEISAYFAQVSYPLIHETENLLRRLIANFMLVTVGRDWTAEVLPGDLAQVLQRRGRDSDPRGSLNFLYTLDFAHLGDLLFAPYSGGSVQDLYAEIQAIKTLEDASKLARFVPRSNWERYFSRLVPCDDSYLRSRWERLYKLRCKVAHNTLMTRADAEAIQKLVNELNPRIQSAIDKLPKVTVPREEAEAVAENVARGVHTAIGEFISAWQEIEAVAAERLAFRGVKSQRAPSGSELARHGLLDGQQAALYDSMRKTRNAIVHGQALDLPAEAVHGYATSLHGLLAVLEEQGRVEYLYSLSDEDRSTALQEMLDDMKYEIVEAEAFSNAIAETNASDWDVHEFVIDHVEFDLSAPSCTVRFSFNASGEQDPDRMYTGTDISGEGTAFITDEDRVEVEVLSASVDHGEDDVSQ